MASILFTRRTLHPADAMLAVAALSFLVVGFSMMMLAT